MSECKLIIGQGEHRNELDTRSPDPLHALNRVVNILSLTGFGNNPTITQIECIDTVTNKIVWTLNFGANNEPISNS